jgi:Ca-activated chloride channel family protein
MTLADRDDAALAALAAAGGGRYAPMTTDAGDIDALKSAAACRSVNSRSRASG